MTVEIYAATRSGTESLQVPGWIWWASVYVFRNRKYLTYLNEFLYKDTTGR